jgi:predicted short-subunit dehydrogenase-like oxidoreductase (DUF2520 family)
VTQRPPVAIVGAGSFATGLALALKSSGYTISEIISRDSISSRQHARRLARKVAARAVTFQAASPYAQLLWFAVPDREIRRASSELAMRIPRPLAGNAKFAFHSSGALLSGELAPLRELGVACASVHPLMTFVPKAHPSLQGVPFALEGDAPAVRLARRIVRELGGLSFPLPGSRKAAYHAWATMTSPLLLAFLVALEEAARGAGLSRQDARRRSLPIIRQTLTNYSRLGPDHSFSGPIIRGDVATVARHLAVLKKTPPARAVYVALAGLALGRLPAKNSREMARLLRD